MSSYPISNIAITVECLQAGHGDALLITCHNRHEESWVALIDTGPRSVSANVLHRLAQLPERNGQRHLDLLVITHIDHDHIGSVHAVLSDQELAIGDIWFNGERQIAPFHKQSRTFNEGQRLNDQLTFEVDKNWNKAFDQQAVVVPEGRRFVAYSMSGGPTITVLGPTVKDLTRLANKWDRELINPAVPTRSDNVTTTHVEDIETLANTRYEADRSVTNRSSIALLIEHAGASVLLTGDATSEAISIALRYLLEERHQAQPLHVDVMKVSHHGSRKNTSNDLLETVRASHYLISTDATRHGLPNHETLARLVKDQTVPHTVHFNYEHDSAKLWQQWAQNLENTSISVGAVNLPVTQSQ